MLFSFCSSRDGASSICCIARPLIAVLKVRSRRRTFSRARSLLSPPPSLSPPRSPPPPSLSLSLSLSLLLSRRVRARTPVHAACAVQGRARLYACLFLLLFREPWLTVSSFVIDGERTAGAPAEVNLTVVISLFISAYVNIGGTLRGIRILCAGSDARACIRMPTYRALSYASVFINDKSRAARVIVMEL
jgi:hypothetical protein